MHNNLISYSKFVPQNIDNYIRDKKIPPYIYKTAEFPFDQIPKEILDVLNDNCTKSANYTTVYLSNLDRIEFIKKYFPEYYVDYHNLIPGAYQADIIRLLILYQFGGVYTDIGFAMIKDMDLIIDPDDELVLVKDLIDSGKYGIYNAFMASYPRHPVILAMIKRVMANVHNKLYGESYLDITGPQAVGKAFNVYFGNDEKKDIIRGSYKEKGHKIKNYQLLVYYNDDGTNHGYIADQSNNHLIKTKFKNYYSVMYDKNNIHYAELYKMRKVYRNNEPLINIVKSHNNTIHNNLISYSKFVPQNIVNYIRDRKIPPYIYKTASFDFDQIPKEMLDVLNYNCTKTSNYTTVYLSDHDIDLFVKKYFPEYYHDFKNIIPGAYRADIFRLLILYQFGGVYTDIGFVMIMDMDQIVDQSDELVLVKERAEGGPYGIYNAFMASYPRHPVILAMINRVMANVHNKIYCESSLDITGPHAIGKAFNVYFGNDEKTEIIRGKYRLKEHTIKFLLYSVHNGDYVNNGYLIDQSNNYLIKTKFPNYYSIMYNKNNIPYGQLYNMRKVYRNIDPPKSPPVTHIDMYAEGNTNTFNNNIDQSNLTIYIITGVLLLIIIIVIILLVMCYNNNNKRNEIIVLQTNST